MINYTKEEVLELFGASAEVLATELNDFTSSAKILSSDHPRLVDLYPMKFIGIYDGKVAVEADDFGSLRDQLHKKNIPIEKTIIRFIDKEERTILL